MNRKSKFVLCMSTFLQAILTQLKYRICVNDSSFIEIIITLNCTFLLQQKNIHSVGFPGTRFILIHC